MFKEKKITREIRKYSQQNDNENKSFQNLCDAAKAVLWGKFIVVNIYIRKEESLKVSDLRFHLKKLEKEEQIKSKVEGRK